MTDTDFNPSPSTAAPARSTRRWIDRPARKAGTRAGLARALAGGGRDPRRRRRGGRRWSRPRSARSRTSRCSMPGRGARPPPPPPPPPLHQRRRSTRWTRPSWTGATSACGVVTGICGPRNRILAAKVGAVDGAPRPTCCLRAGRALAPSAARTASPSREAAYFHTREPLQALQDTLARRRKRASRERRGRGAVRHGGRRRPRPATAHVAAATSTGGMTAKAPGRIGDTPVFGAGHLRRRRSLRHVGTGRGEIFVRWCAAIDLHARMLLPARASEGAGAW